MSLCSNNVLLFQHCGIHSMLTLLHHGLLELLLTTTFVDGLGDISSYANASLRSTVSRF